MNDKITNGYDHSLINNNRSVLYIKLKSNLVTEYNFPEALNVTNYAKSLVMFKQKEIYLLPT